MKKETLVFIGGFYISRKHNIIGDVKMPIVAVYVPNHIYRRIVLEAREAGMSEGKYIKEILEVWYNGAKEQVLSKRS